MDKHFEVKIIGYRVSEMFLILLFESEEGEHTKTFKLEDDLIIAKLNRFLLTDEPATIEYDGREVDLHAIDDENVFHFLESIIKAERKYTVEFKEYRKTRYISRVQ